MEFECADLNLTKEGAKTLAYVLCMADADTKRIVISADGSGWFISEGGNIIEFNLA